MQDTTDIYSSVSVKLKIQVSPLSLKRKKEKENLSENPNKVQTIYIHMKNTYMKIYKEWNNNKHTNEKYIHENI